MDIDKQPFVWIVTKQPPSDMRPNGNLRKSYLNVARVLTLPYTTPRNAHHARVIPQETIITATLTHLDDIGLVNDCTYYVDPTSPRLKLESPTEDFPLEYFQTDKLVPGVIVRSPSLQRPTASELQELSVAHDCVRIEQSATFYMMIYYSPTHREDHVFILKLVDKDDLMPINEDIPAFFALQANVNNDGDTAIMCREVTTSNRELFADNMSGLTSAASKVTAQYKSAKTGVHGIALTFPSRPTEETLIAHYQNALLKYAEPTGPVN